MKVTFTLLSIALLPAFLLAQNPPLFKNFKQGTFEADAFTTNNFKCIGVGKNNVIWAGSQYGGLYTYSDSFNIWRKSDKLTNVFINDIKADGDSGIWIAQSGTQSTGNVSTNIAGGINYFPVGSDIRMEFYSVPGTNTGADIWSRNVRAVYPDRSKKQANGDKPRVWAAQGSYRSANAGLRGGLSIGLNPFESYFTNIREGFSNISTSPVTADAITGGNGKVWVSVRLNDGKSQILEYTAAGKYITAYDRDNVPALDNNFTAQALHYDRFGQLWVGMRQGGLYIKRGEEWLRMNWESKIPPGTQINQNAIASDKYGNVYIGTSSGLLEFLSRDFYPSSSPDNPSSYTLYTEADGLPSNNITGVAYDDKNGRILITSAGGVTFMNKSEPFIKGVVFDVFTNLDSTNTYAGLQKKPLSGEVRVRLFKDGAEEEIVTPDADGIFELKKAEDSKVYTVEVAFQRNGKTMKYIYNDIKNHTLMLPILMPDSLIRELKAFKPKLEKRCFPIKLPFTIEIDACREGFITDGFEVAFEPFYDAAGIKTDHDKRVENLANYYTSLATVYNLGGFATDLFNDMITNTFDAIQSLDHTVEYSFTTSPYEDKSQFRLELKKKVAMLKVLKEGLNLIFGKVSSSISDPDIKYIFDLTVTIFNDQADLLFDALELNNGVDGLNQMGRKALLDNIKKIAAAQLAATFYKEYFARTRHYDFVERTADASKNARSGYTYTETFDNLYSPSANSLVKYGTDTLTYYKDWIGLLTTASKVGDAVAATADAIDEIAALGGGPGASAFIKGIGLFAKVVKTAALVGAVYEGARGSYDEVLLSDKVIVKAGLNRNNAGGVRRDANLQLSPAKLLERKNSYNQKLSELQAVYNSPSYNKAAYDQKFAEFLDEDSLYTDEMIKMTNTLWASTNKAVTTIPGFGAKLNRVIDSFVSQQYTLRNALFYQNDAFAWDTDKPPYLAELNSLANEIKTLNDSSLTGIASLIDDINNNDIGAPAYLVQESYKISHNRKPGSTATVTYTFKNYGAEAQTNVSFKISTPTEGFVLTSTDSIYGGTIQPGETKQISYSFMSPSATDSFTIGRYQIHVNADNGRFKDVSGSLYIFSQSVLPVTLSAFDVTCTNAGAKLVWQTATEVNGSHFDVEKNINGQWNKVYTIKAAGSSSSKKDYAFTDADGSNALYRLKQVDKDGTYTYSGIKQANCQPKQPAITVYPVPANNVLNVAVSIDKNAQLNLLLTDLSGRVVKQQNTDVKKGTTYLKLNIAGLAAGQYFLHVAGADIFKNQKVLITQ